MGQNSLATFTLQILLYGAFKLTFSAELMNLIGIQKQLIQY